MARLSLDALYCKAFPMALDHDPDFTPEESVKSVSFWPVTGSEELAIIVPGWHNPEWFLKRKAAMQNKLGRSELYLTIDDNILSTDVQRTLESYEVIAQRYAVEISRRGVAPSHWQAASLGGSILMYILGTQPLPAPTIHMIAPGADLAHSIWAGIRTQPLKHRFEAQGMTANELSTLWRPLSPLYQAPAIHDARVRLDISHADEIIPPDGAFELAVAFSEAGNDVTVFTNRHLGHYGTVAASLAEA